MSVSVAASPRNHLKLRYQIAHISRPNRAAFLRSQVLMVAPSRNHLNLRTGQVLADAGPRNQTIHDAIAVPAEPGAAMAFWRLFGPPAAYAHPAPARRSPRPCPGAGIKAVTRRLIKASVPAP